MSSKINFWWARLKPYFTFATFVFGLMATIFGPIPLLSLLQKVVGVWNWKIELVGLPKLLLSEYQRLRTAALKPIIDFLDLAITLPDWLVYILTTWVADFFSMYMLLVISVVRGSMVDRRFDRIKFKAAPEKFRQQLRAIAALHKGRDPEIMIAKAEAGLQHGLKGWMRFQRRNWIGAFQWPLVIKRNYIQLRRGVALDLTISRVVMWAIMLGCAILGTIFYILGSLIAR